MELFNQEEKCLSELLEVTPEDALRFSEQAKRISADGLNRMLELFMRAEPDAKWASRPRTILELAAVRACHPEKEEDSTVNERLDRVEKLIESGAAARPVQSAQRPAAKKEEKSPQKQEKAPTPTPSEEPPQAYLDAIERLRGENPSIRTPLDSMRFIRFDGQQVAVEFSKKGIMHMKLLERKKPLIEEILAETFGQPVGIAMSVEGSGDSEKRVSDVAREVINQAHDVFGRENISLEE